MAGYVMHLRNERAQNILDDLGASGAVELWSGTRPATGLAGTGTKLVSVPLKSPAGVLANAVITFTKPDDVQATGAGTCTWARLVDSAAAALIDLSVSDVNGAGEIKINDLNVTVGLWVSVQAINVTEGNP
jgi:hypothetical protein